MSPEQAMREQESPLGPLLVLLCCLASLLAVGACVDAPPDTPQFQLTQADLDRRDAIEAYIAAHCTGKVTTRILCSKTVREQMR